VRFTKAARLRRRREFLAVQARGRKLTAGPYLVLLLPNGCGRARLGITVSSKVADAVGRNQVKRWVREAFRARAAALPRVDVVVIARREAPTSGLTAARAAIETAIRAGGTAA
jgi:ribonuclease P protein component